MFKGTGLRPRANKNPSAEQPYNKSKSSYKKHNKTLEQITYFTANASMNNHMPPMSTFNDFFESDLFIGKIIHYLDIHDLLNLTIVSKKTHEKSGKIRADKQTVNHYFVASSEELGDEFKTLSKLSVLEMIKDFANSPEKRALRYLPLLSNKHLNMEIASAIRNFALKIEEQPNQTREKKQKIIEIEQTLKNFIKHVIDKKCSIRTNSIDKKVLDILRQIDNFDSFIDDLASPNYTVKDRLLRFIPIFFFGLVACWSIQNTFYNNNESFQNRAFFYTIKIFFFAMVSYMYNYNHTKQNYHEYIFRNFWNENVHKIADRDTQKINIIIQQ